MVCSKREWLVRLGIWMVCKRQVQAYTTGGPYALTSKGERVEDGVMARGSERKGRKACSKGEGKITVKQVKKIHTDPHTHSYLRLKF